MNELVRRWRSWWAAAPAWPAPGEAEIVIPDEYLRQRHTWAALLEDELG